VVDENGDLENIADHQRGERAAGARALRAGRLLQYREQHLAGREQVAPATQQCIPERTGR
jgi:hypothetical protein